MEAMEILSKYYDFDLDFNMNIKYNYCIRVNNLATFSSYEMNYLTEAGFLVTITTNIGHTDDGYGFLVCIF